MPPCQIAQDRPFSCENTEIFRFCDFLSRALRGSLADVKEGKVKMRLLMAAMALVAAPAMASDAEIEPDAWRALTTGKTLHYWKDGQLYGREYYAPDGKSTVFRFPNGLCAEGQWAFADRQYCFAYGGQLHCFKHIQRGDDIIILGLEDGEEQKVEKIAENEPLTCAEAVNS